MCWPFRGLPEGLDSVSFVLYHWKGPTYSRYLGATENKRARSQCWSRRPKVKQTEAGTAQQPLPQWGKNSGACIQHYDFPWDLFLSYLTQKVDRIWHPLQDLRLLKTESWAVCGSSWEFAVLQIKITGTKKFKDPEKRGQQIPLTVNLTVQVKRRCIHRKGSGVQRISSKAAWKDLSLYKAGPGRLEEVVIFQTCGPETKLQTTWRNKETWSN